MDVLIFLIPIALFLGGLGLAGFLWSLRSGQYDDLDGAAWRAIMDDDLPPGERAIDGPPDGGKSADHSTRSSLSARS